jgi:TolA-binding protein
MKATVIAMVTAVTAAIVMLGLASRAPGFAQAFHPMPASVPSARQDDWRSTPTGPAPVQARSIAAGPALPRSERVTPDAAQAAAAPAASAPPPSDEQVAALRQLVVQARRENEQLQQIDEQLASLPREAAQESGRREAARQEAAQLEAARHDATLQALGTLRRAEALLAIGDSDGVDDELSRAEAALFGRTRLDVDAAREALGRSDLFAARESLAAALAERRPLR